MNERIRELAKQSGLWFVSPREDLMNDFAELIVRECVRLAEETPYPHHKVKLHEHTWDMACIGASRYIQKHFGIEE